MDTSIPTEILDKLTTFGELLRYLRRRAGLTQTGLSIAVGYSEAQISRLEQNRRPPNLATVQARFLPVLKLRNEPLATDRLLQLAKSIQRGTTPLLPRATEARPGGRALAIAVLPFLNRTKDPENEYFCEGLAEELIGALTRIKLCLVVARGSAFSFRGQNIDVREIGRRLNVDIFLEGTVQRTGDRLRVSTNGRSLNSCPSFVQVAMVYYRFRIEKGGET